MNRLPHILITLVVLCGFAAPALAASSASSASSDGSSTSVGSSSTSLETSSDSSSKADKVAEGDYRITEIAVADTQPGKVRVKLQPVDGKGADFVLVLPQQAAQQGRLAAGGVVTAQKHAYGLQFAAGAPREAFFLVLHDEWYRELQTRVVTL